MAREYIYSTNFIKDIGKSFHVGKLKSKDLQKERLRWMQSFYLTLLLLTIY